MQKFKFSFTVLLTAGLLTLAFLGCQKSNEDPLLTSNARPATKLSTPTVTCGTSSEVSINLTVTAGATGAPAGFSVQWMTELEYIDNGNAWYLSEDPRLCKASFSGNANASRYNLLPNQTTSVNIGEMLMDNGASTNCPDALRCGTKYIFRVFAHNAPQGLSKSEWTANLLCSTLACRIVTGECTYTQGYWKTHGPIPTGNNSNMWPVNSLTLGSVNYTALELQSILDQSASGNGLIILAHQLIAAKLNEAKGADVTDIAVTIVAADALISSLVCPPVGSGSLAPSATSALTTALANFNEGATGPGHCN